MSFNLKKYSKSKDLHVEKRLRDSSDVLPLNEISESLLKEYRSGEKQEVLERILEKSRKNDSSVLTEAGLNRNDSKIAKHRDQSSHSGDINKLEEQRLGVFNEKAHAASKDNSNNFFNKKLKSEDGLKLAQVSVNEGDVSFFENEDDLYDEQPDYIDYYAETFLMEMERDIDTSTGTPIMKGVVVVDSADFSEGDYLAEDEIVDFASSYLEKEYPSIHQVNVFKIDHSEGDQFVRINYVAPLSQSEGQDFAPMSVAAMSMS